MRLDGSNIRSGTRCIYRIYAARYVRDLKENCGRGCGAERFGKWK